MPRLRSILRSIQSLLLISICYSYMIRQCWAFSAKPCGDCKSLRRRHFAMLQHSIEEHVSIVKTGSESVESKIIACFNRIDSVDKHVGAFLSLQRSAALESALGIDEKIATGDSDTMKLPLLGVPIAIKDNLCLKGVETTAASRILEGYRPSYDATVVRKLREAGAIIVGKTNMDEFSMGSTTETSAYQRTFNPRNLNFVPGGSSGGSAAAVASGGVLVSLGSDTGGSVRQPASWCGVVGIKPTYGRVSRSGLIAYASSLDCIGPIATSVMDASILLSVISGPDPSHDATTDSFVPSLPDFRSLVQRTDSISRSLEGVRIGVIKEAFDAKSITSDVTAATRKAADVLESLGAHMVDVSLPKLPEQCAAYYINALSEASANLARFDGVRYGSRDPNATSAKIASLHIRHDRFGPEVRRRILLGTFSLSSGYSDKYYMRAQLIRSELNCDFARVFESVDVLMCPTAPTTAYKLGEYEIKGVDSYADDLFTVPASLAGLPAMSLPCGLAENGLPIGLQLIGNMWQEEDIIKVGYAYECATEWHDKLAPGLAKFS